MLTQEQFDQFIIRENSRLKELNGYALRRRSSYVRQCLYSARHYREQGDKQAHAEALRCLRGAWAAYRQTMKVITS